jgi:Tfp pilus assembly protein PilF
MAKSGKPSPKSPSPKQTIRPQKELPVLQDYLERPPVDQTGLPWFKRPTPDQFLWAFLALSLLGMVYLSLGSGINADDKFQCDYSGKLVNYYTSFGKDTTALNIPEGNMHLYGGFFEVVTGFTNKALGFQQNQLAYHQVRNVSSAIMGWLAILCTVLFARLIAGGYAGLITLVIMLVSPRFMGDSMMNPKDIPFAAGYMMALYNMAMVLGQMPNPKRWNIIGLVAGLGIGLATRAGGLLPFGMLFMFAGLHFLLKNGGIAAVANRQALVRYATITFGVAVAGYVLALIFWPYALQSPLKNPFVALSKFSDLEVKIRVLFDGVNMMSDKTPWYYSAKWILITIPLTALAGFAGFLALLPRLYKQYNPLWIGMVLFAGVFPVFYVIYKHSVLHDGWRHLTFAYPPIALAAGLAWNELSRLVILQPEKSTGYRQGALAGFAALFLLISAHSALYIAQNPRFAYTYFNPIVGGVEGAYGHYETDYWGVSVRQGIEWMEQQGILKPDMPEQVIIATNMYYSAKQLTAKYGDKVKIKYLKWEKRCDDAWDYALYPTRFLEGVTLQKGKWPPDNAVHVVEANGKVPLLAVLKDNGRNCVLGMASIKIGDYQNAIDRLKAELGLVPDNELAWAGLSQAYLNTDKLEESKAAAEKALEIAPNDVQSNNLIGMYFMQKNDAAGAKSQFEKALKKEPSNPSAWYYLAVIARSQQDNQTALSDLNKAIQLAPNFKPAYELSAQIYESTGNQSAAQQYRAALGQLK